VNPLTRGILIALLVEAFAFGAVVGVALVMGNCG
jgi:hypothetical protein